jgi:hypothetical protein
LLEAYRAGEQEVHEGEHMEGDKVGLSVVSSAPRLPVRSVPSASLDPSEEGRHARHGKVARVRMEFRRSRCLSAW